MGLFYAIFAIRPRRALVSLISILKEGKIMLHVNRRIKDIVGSTTLAITARAKELQTQGHDVVNFGAGEPDFDTPDFIKEAGIKAIQSGQTKYTPSIGTQD